jgi:Uma2 family endonuclease
MFAASGSQPASAGGGVLPPDARLAEPETRYELIDGKRVYVSPADEPHATEHFALGYLLAAHVGVRYRGAVDMLTRTSETSDYAPDASVFPADPDPETGGRRLEELAFEIDRSAEGAPHWGPLVGEIASTQSRASATRKARGLAGRGVRRVFCLDLRGRRVLEWDRDDDDWRAADAAGAIADRCFVKPLPIAALLDAAGRDDEVARALLAKRNPVIEQAVAEGEARGEARSLLRFLEARGLDVPEELRARILACTDRERLDRWIGRAATAASATEVVDDPE